MTKDEALKLALEALEDAGKDDFWRYQDKAITAIKEALAQPEPWEKFCDSNCVWTDHHPDCKLAQPEQKYRRGNRLICLETEEYCVIHISGTDRQWVKFPDSHIGVYTNEQVAELFELLPKDPEQEPVAWATREDFYFELNRRVDRMREEMMIKTITMRCKEYDLALPIVDMYGGHIVVGQVSFPPQRKPLTEQEIGAILEDINAFGTRLYTFARAIEAAHGIKGEA